jgi:hypothetical protein
LSELFVDKYSGIAIVFQAVVTLIFFWGGGVCRMLFFVPEGAIVSKFFAARVEGLTMETVFKKSLLYAY